jgi:hypothetical protein
MVPLVGQRVRFYEPYRPSQVRWGGIGTIVDVGAPDDPRTRVMGARAFRRLPHDVDRGVAIGAGELSSVVPLGRRQCSGRSVLTRSPIDVTEVKFAGD